jgi:hypothetical protein
MGEKGFEDLATGAFNFGGSSICQQDYLSFSVIIIL